LPTDGIEVDCHDGDACRIAAHDLLGDGPVPAGFEQKSLDAAVAQATVQIGGGRRGQSLAARRHRSDHRSDLVGEGVVESPVQRHQVAGAVRKVVEEGALRHAGRGDDGVDAQPLEP